MEDFEEEDRRFQKFIEFGESTDNQMSLQDYIEMKNEGDNQLNMFIEGYRSGILVESFHTLDDMEKEAHIHLLEMIMIYVRKRLNNMEKYQEMKDIVEKLKLKKR